MLTKCERKLAVRWIVMILSVGYLSILGFYLIEGRVPVADTIRFGTGEIWHQPFVLSRLVDPFVVLVSIALLVVVWVNFSSILPLDEEDTVMSKVLSTLAGLAAIFIITPCGLAGVFWGVVILSLFVLFVLWLLSEGDTHHVLWGGFILHITTAITIWTAMTVIVGAVAGTVYAVAALVIAAAVHFGVIGICYGILAGAKLFERTMLTCDIETQTPQE